MPFKPFATSFPRDWCKFLVTVNLTQGLSLLWSSWVGIASCLCCSAALPVCIEAVGLGGQNMSRKWHPPNLAPQFTSGVKQDTNFTACQEDRRLRWKCGFSSLRVPNSHLLSLLPSSAFTLIHGHGLTKRETREGEGEGELGSAIHNPSSMANNYHMIHIRRATLLLSSGPDLACTGCPYTYWRVPYTYKFVIVVAWNFNCTGMKKCGQGFLLPRLTFHAV